MFDDRLDAGRQLGNYLRHLGVAASIVLGIPRGGVPVAAEVAAALGLPLDVVVVRKLGLPTHPEVAIGAIGEGGVRIIDEGTRKHSRVSREELNTVERAEQEVVAERSDRFRRDRPSPDLAGQRVLIVDDGIATGATASAACGVARTRGAAWVVVAAPVGGRDAPQRVGGADQVLCLLEPEQFWAVGAHYRDFEQTSDAEAERILRRADTDRPPR